VINTDSVMATLALLGFVVASFAIFVVKRPEDAVIAFVLAAAMFLPVNAFFKFPSFPPLDRMTLPYLVLLGPIVVRRFRRVRKLRFGRGVEWLLFVAFFATAIGTVVTNRDPLTYGNWSKITLPGMGFRDGLAMAIGDLLTIGIPFFLGRAVMRSSREGKRLLSALVVGGLIYSFFILLEVRLSPQVHRWIYGYFARDDDFSQVMRWGGYRPVVFMPHGLAVAIFMACTVMAAFTFVKARLRIRGLPAKPLAFFLLFILVICKSTGAIIYVFLLLPILMFTKPRTQMRVATLIAVLVVLYPAMRGGNIFPVQTFITAANKIGRERADSLQFRFDNEDQLLAKARERLPFGWGSYGRNSIYDRDEGKEIAVTDGHWIIVFGTRGLVGAICHFGLLLIPVFIAARRRRKIPDKHDQVIVCGLTLTVVMSVTDLIPNGLFCNYPYFLSGCLLGLVHSLTSPEAIAQAQAEQAAANVDPRAQLRGESA
jgi:hypothetical protein